MKRSTINFFSFNLIVLATCLYAAEPPFGAIPADRFATLVRPTVFFFFKREDGEVRTGTKLNVNRLIKSALSEMRTLNIEVDPDYPWNIDGSIDPWIEHIVVFERDKCWVVGFFGRNNGQRVEESRTVGISSRRNFVGTYNKEDYSPLDRKNSEHYDSPVIVDLYSALNLSTVYHDGEQKIAVEMISPLQMKSPNQDVIRNAIPNKPAAIIK